MRQSFISPNTAVGFNQNTLRYQAKFFGEMKLLLYTHSCFHQLIYNPVKERQRIYLTSLPCHETILTGIIYIC